MKVTKKELKRLIEEIVDKKLNEGNTIPDAKKLIGNQEWADKNYLNHAQRWINNANKSDHSDSYRKYIQFVVKSGHLTPSASSVFEDWLEADKNELSISDVETVLSELWSSEDDESKFRLKHYAKNIGIK